MADPKPNTGPLGVPPGGPWFVFPLSGTVQRQDNPVAAEALVVAGWVGFATYADAQTAAHTGSIPAITRGAASSVAGAVNGASGAVTSVGDFLSRLTAGATWIRVAEVALGLLLIAVGIAKLTNAVPIATRAARTLGSVA